MMSSRLWPSGTSVAACVGALALAGCNSYTFNSPADKDIPGIISSRGILLASSEAYMPETILGRIYKVTDNSPILKTSDLAGEFKPKESRLITPELTEDAIYESKITAGFELNAAYLSAAAGLAGDEAAEIIITDLRAHQLEARDLYPDEEALAAIIENAKSRVGLRPGDQLVLITGVVMSVIHTKSYRALRSETNIAGGAFGIDGKVYASEAGFQLLRVIGFTGRPLYRVPAGEGVAPPFLPSVMTYSRDDIRRARVREAVRAIEGDVLRAPDKGK